MSSAKNSDLPLRLASALVLGTIVLGVTWYGGLLFRLLMVLAALLIHHEWSKITTSKETPAKPQPVTILSWIFVGLGAVAIILADPVRGLVICAVAVLVLGVWEFAKNRRFWMAGGVIYALAPAIALAQIREAPNGLIMILLIFVIVWGTDIGAYFAGRTLGGPKLAPAISPKKTWSGFLGGLTAAILGTLILLSFFQDIDLPLTMVSAGIMAGFLSVISQLGDLFESWIKRLFKVKDSGQLIPGHGGIMDRVDGLVVVAVGFYGLLVSGLI